MGRPHRAAGGGDAAAGQHLHPPGLLPRVDAAGARPGAAFCATPSCSTRRCAGRIQRRRQTHVTFSDRTTRIHREICQVTHPPSMPFKAKSGAVSLCAVRPAVSVMVLYRCKVCRLCTVCSARWDFCMLEAPRRRGRRAGGDGARRCPCRTRGMRCARCTCRTTTGTTTTASAAGTTAVTAPPSPSGPTGRHAPA